jgi:hypothetical protein
MRKIAAALATAALAAIAVAGPTGVAGAQTPDDVETISCGTVGPPVCEVLAEVTGLLAPLEPALALTGPVLSDLGTTISSLGQLGLSGGAVPVDDLSGAAGSMIAQLDALSGPAADILDATGQGDALRSALQRLVDGLAALPVGDVLEQTGVAPAPTAPAPAPAPSSSPSKSAAKPSKVGSTSSSAPTGFGGSVSVSGASARSSSSRVPSVPVGSSLHLGSLAMPEFHITSPAVTKAAERSVSEIVLPAAQAAAVADELGDDGHAMAVLGALSALLLAGGLLLDHVRKTRHVIPF